MLHKCIIIIIIICYYFDAKKSVCAAREAKKCVTLKTRECSVVMSNLFSQSLQGALKLHSLALYSVIWQAFFKAASFAFQHICAAFVFIKEESQQIKPSRITY